MRAEYSEALFLLASPGEEGYGGVRPFRPGVCHIYRGYEGENRLKHTVLLIIPPTENVSPGDGLFPPDTETIGQPEYLIRTVRTFPDHLEAEAEEL